MKKVTDIHGGTTAYLLLYRPDWRSGFEARLELPVAVQRGLTGREARRSFGETLRVEAEFTLLLGPGEASAFRNALQDPDQPRVPVWFPFWPGEWEAGATGAPVGAARWLVLSPGAEPVIHTGPVSPGTYPAGSTMVPLLAGRFIDPPDSEAITDELLEVRVRLRDQGNAAEALTVAPGTFPDGPSTGGRAFPVFPLRADFRVGVESGSAEAETDHRQIGYARAEAPAIYPHNPARTVAFSTVATSEGQWRDLLAFLVDREGSVQPFWLPTHLADLRLAADTSAGSPTVQLSGSPAALGGNRFLHFVSPGGSASREILETTEGPPATATLATSPGVFRAVETSISTLALVRLVRPLLNVRWETPAVAAARVDFREVPPEYVLPSSESYSTLGALSRRAFLYRFSAGPEVWTFTSFERAIEHEDVFYEVRPIDHGDIREGLNLERDEVTIRTRTFAGNPLLRFLPFRLETPLRLEIFEGTIPEVGSDLGTLHRVFVGEVVSVETDGPFLTARVSAFGNLFERRLPRWLIQPTCNWAVYDTACGLDRIAWKRTAEVLDAFTPNSHRLLVRALGAGASAIPAHAFAGGWLEYEIEEGPTGSRTILDSTAANGSGDLELSLASDLHPWPEVGQEITIFPGCDGRRETCQTVFANYVRFGGFPFMPVGNPSMVKMPQNRHMK